MNTSQKLTSHGLNQSLDLYDIVEISEMKGKY